MTCGVCLEVCPNVTQNNKFVGAQAISQVRLFDLHPTGAMTKDERLDALMSAALQECGNSQNCVNACPKGIPLTTSIAAMNRETTFHMFKSNVRKIINSLVLRQFLKFVDLHPTGAMTKDERLDALMSAGGLQECGNSQNCVNACPKGIPLTTSIAAMNRETTFHMFKSFFGSDHKVD